MVQNQIKLRLTPVVASWKSESECVVTLAGALGAIAVDACEYQVRSKPWVSVARRRKKEILGASLGIVNGKMCSTNAYEM